MINKLGPIWQDISDQAKDLIMKMLKFRPDQRLTAEAAYSHDWIQKKKFNQLKPETAFNLMNNLKSFHVILSYECNIVD